MFGISNMRATILAAFALAALAISGCGYGPEETVRIEVSGAADDARRTEIKEKLKAMTDGASHSMSAFSSGDSLVITLAPVSDVEGFSERIDFGEVTAVEERVVRVRVGQKK